MWINDRWINDGTENIDSKSLKRRARLRLRQAIYSGKIKKQACEVCDTDHGIIDAHHPDYRLPLDVLWLCRKHHQELHRYIGYYEIAYEP